MSFDGNCMVSMADIRLMNTLFKLIGNASENRAIPLLSDKNFLVDSIVFFELNKSMADEKKAETNSPMSMPMHTKDNEKLAPILVVQ